MMTGLVVRWKEGWGKGGRRHDVPAGGTRSQMEGDRCQPGEMCQVEGQRARWRNEMPGGIRGGPPLRDRSRRERERTR